jgi:predicted TIM-barrel fold metal-dependent hydrolase
MGEMFLGYRGCYGPEYVDPYYIQPLIKEYNNVTFILVHTGADFLPAGDKYYFSQTNVEHSIEMAYNYSNVYLEISAFFTKGQ